MKAMQEGAEGRTFCVGVWVTPAPDGAAPEHLLACVRRAFEHTAGQTGSDAPLACLGAFQAGPAVAATADWPEGFQSFWAVARERQEDESGEFRPVDQLHQMLRAERAFGLGSGMALVCATWPLLERWAPLLNGLESVPHMHLQAAAFLGLPNGSSSDWVPYFLPRTPDLLDRLPVGPSSEAVALSLLESSALQALADVEEQLGGEKKLAWNRARLALRLDATLEAALLQRKRLRM